MIFVYKTPLLHFQIITGSYSIVHGAPSNNHYIAVSFLVPPVKTTPQDKLKQLQQMLRDMKSCAIAYSGGVDSTFLIKVAYDILGKNALAVTATSSTYPKRELQDAKQFAKIIGIPHVIIHSEELDIAKFSGQSSRPMLLL